METRQIKELIISTYNNSVVNNTVIINQIQKKDLSVPKGTVNWILYDMVKRGEANRIGKGVYSFSEKKDWVPKLSQRAEGLRRILIDNFPYLKVTIIDTSQLQEFMIQQPFQYPLILEVARDLVESVVTKLQQLDVNAYAKKDYRLADIFRKNDYPVYVTKAIQTTASFSLQKNIKAAKLEKILVDALCEPKLYSQFQGWELENIYVNALEKYIINFSQLLKYATSRGRKAEVLKLLEGNISFNKYREAEK